MLLAGLLTVALLTTPADSLRTRLERGQTVNVVVLGDSIGDGMHLRPRDRGVSGAARGLARTALPDRHDSAP